MSKVTYYYDDDVANYSYGKEHPMKPYRIRLTHELIASYQLLPKLDAFVPTKLSRNDLVKFHADDFIDFLQEATPYHQSQLSSFLHQKRENHLLAANDQPILHDINPDYAAQMEMWAQKFKRYGVDGDCPVFEGLYKYCEIYSGGSVGGAWKLNRGAADIAINWAGGLHHAKKAEVSGFCYVNDIVLAILELLRYHERVLYIDIDVHHGDGVEEAFYTSDRVMTVSFHNYGDNFFPATGSINDIGEGKGRNYSLNFPLSEGITDQTYENLFKSIIGSVMENYRPGAIVLQCGADSLTGDKLGPFNLTLRGHGFCVAYCKSLGVPLLLLGGGGYTVRNVARAWAYETSLALGTELDNELPFNNYIQYWSPDYKLHLEPSDKRPDMNTREDLHQREVQLLQQLKDIGGPPSVQYSTEAPRDSVMHGWREDAAAERRENGAMDTSSDGAVQGRQHQSEFYAGAKDQDGTTMGIVRPKPTMPLNNIAASTPSPATASSSVTRNNIESSSPMEQ